MGVPCACNTQEIQRLDDGVGHEVCSALRMLSRSDAVGS
jgi:hypothetical protein